MSKLWDAECMNYYALVCTNYYALVCYQLRPLYCECVYTHTCALLKSGCQPLSISCAHSCQH